MFKLNIKIEIDKLIVSNDINIIRCNVTVNNMKVTVDIHDIYNIRKYNVNTYKYTINNNIKMEAFRVSEYKLINLDLLINQYKTYVLIIGEVLDVIKESMKNSDISDIEDIITHLSYVKTYLENNIDILKKM